MAGERGLRSADQFVNGPSPERAAVTRMRRLRPFGSHATRFETSQADPAPQSASCHYGSLVIVSRCGEVRKRRAELAKYDMRRSTIRRPRDDMRRCTIRRPREPASEVAKIASSLRRLEPPVRAIARAL